MLRGGWLDRSKWGPFQRAEGAGAEGAELDFLTVLAGGPKKEMSGSNILVNLRLKGCHANSLSTFSPLLETL